MQTGTVFTKHIIQAQGEYLQHSIYQVSLTKFIFTGYTAY